MHANIGFGTFCAALFLVSPAFAAVTITNQDSRTHTLTVNSGIGETPQDIMAGKAAELNCPANCGFRDEAFGYSRVAGGDAKLVIDKDGELHFSGGHGDVVMLDGSN
ncbi:hypothetical protein [Beijerinckia sp. L45]|uniref:hypothetical protein n=1 Tax=Beijerinckia sp. L45 TaxID=1641855 RepID=UPI00131B8F2E|nr:hypothetical protein [Beijerinckia sp. L45]